MPKTIDLEGSRFGRLVVLRKEGTINKATHWFCKCDCGNTVLGTTSDLNGGKKKSCGCLHREVSARNIAKVKTHGMKGTRIYRIWQRMKSRCSNENVNDYMYYGGRGISVCEEWKKFEPFMEWSFANGYTDELTIDRINVDGDYEPNNCRWTTMKEQSKNKSSSIIIDGKTVNEWSEITGIPARTIYHRYHRGWDVQEILRGK